MVAALHRDMVLEAIDGLEVVLAGSGRVDRPPAWRPAA